MKNEFVLAFNEVVEEKQLPRDIILKALESAMVSAYRHAVNGSNAQNVEAKIDPETGRIVIFAEKEVVEQVQDDRTEVSLVEAQRYDPAAELGTMVMVDSTPRDFGRVAAQNARQMIQQRIREAERQAQISYYEKQVGEIVSGVVQAVSAQGLTIGLEMRAEGFLARKDMIPNERFPIHKRARALVSEVNDSGRGPQIVLSRTHRDFLRRLLENEVPEIYHGVVEIRSIAREPGERAKVAVSATQSGIDPVGACVGIKGVRIQAIVSELHNEKIDVIEWNADPVIFIAKALSPAPVLGVYLNEGTPNGKTATVVVPEEKLSLAIGHDGQNARLAAKLTNWRIDIKSLPEAASDALNKLKNDAALANIAQVEIELIPQIESLLTKKAEGRVLTKEEYDQVSRFVDRIERRTSTRHQPDKKAVEESQRQEMRKTIPVKAFETHILDSGLPEHVAVILQEAGYENAGEVVLQMKFHPDDILRLQGIGTKAINEINRLVQQLSEEVAVVAPPAEVTAAEEILVAQPAETVTMPEEVEVAQPAEPEPVEPLVEAQKVEAAPAEAETLPVTEPAETTQAQDQDEGQEDFDKLFAVQQIIPTPPVYDGEEEEEEGSAKKGKKQKRKKKSRYVEYDPEKDTTTVTKKHKGDGWEWE